MSDYGIPKECVMAFLAALTELCRKQGMRLWADADGAMGLVTLDHRNEEYADVRDICWASDEEGYVAEFRKGD